MSVILDDLTTLSPKRLEKHLEALAAGVPVIVSDVAPLREFAERTALLDIVPADDARALAAAIAAVMQDPARARMRAERGRLWAQGEGSWQATADRVTGVYERL